MQLAISLFFLQLHYLKYCKEKLLLLILRTQSETLTSIHHLTIIIIITHTILEPLSWCSMIIIPAFNHSKVPTMILKLVSLDLEYSMGRGTSIMELLVRTFVVWMVL